MSEKRRIGRKPYLYPMPVVLVGAMVDGRPNFEAIAFCGVIESQPAMLAVASGKSHFTNRGIKTSGTFSINIASTDMVAETDYCGIVSGSKVDKSLLFELFYGDLETAPMIQRCPLCMECRLIETLDYGTHEVFIGEVIETYIQESALTDGAPDIRKIDPIIYSHYQNSYWRVGEQLAPAFKIGKEYRPPQAE